MSKPLTIKQEAACQAFILCGDQSKAYREAGYSCNKSAKSINEAASKLFAIDKVRTRVEALQAIAQEISEVEFKHTLTDSLKLDFELIERYKKHIAILENENSTDKQIEIARRTIHYIGVVGFNAAQDRIAKKQGFYEKDNSQKKSDINIISDMTTEELLERAKAVKQIGDA